MCAARLPRCCQRRARLLEGEPVKTAKAATALDQDQVAVWVWPRRPVGWAGLSLTVTPWALPLHGATGWSDGGDVGRFARELIAGLRQQSPARVWQSIHAQAAGLEPVLVSAPSKLGFVVRRAIAEWMEESGLGEIEELPAGAPSLEEMLGYDVWA